MCIVFQNPLPREENCTQCGSYSGCAMSAYTLCHGGSKLIKVLHAEYQQRQKHDCNSDIFENDFDTARRHILYKRHGHIL